MIRYLIAEFPTRLPFDGEATRAHLDRLSKLLLRHLRIEDDRLYPHLEECGNTELAARAAHYRQTMGELQHRFVHFCQRWNASGAITQNPKAFLGEWARLRDMIDARMTIEDEDLYPRAERYFGIASASS